MMSGSCVFQVLEVSKRVLRFSITRKIMKEYRQGRVMLENTNMESRRAAFSLLRKGDGLHKNATRILVDRSTHGWMAIHCQDGVELLIILT